MEIALVIDAYYCDNQIFNENNIIVNRDDCQRQWIDLKMELFRDGISLNTFDITPIEDADLVFFINMPSVSNIDFKKAVSLNKTCYLFINELDLIHPGNGDLDQHKYFKKVFTYQQMLIDNEKYFKVNYSFNFDRLFKRIKSIPFESKNFCTMVAGYKKLNHPNELYSERINTIRWFESNASKQFDLYGFGWNNYGFLRKFVSRPYSSYKGTIINKIDTLSMYKFNICYENAKDIPGWITEKIFDSFVSGTVPIYWGWDGIVNYVNRDCFIDRTQFSSNEDLYKFLSSISKNDHLQYLENINNYLSVLSKSNKFEFSISYFVDLVKQEIHNDFNS